MERGKHTISSSLWNRSLSSTASHADPVDDIALLGLISKTAGFVRARGS